MDDRRRTLAAVTVIIGFLVLVAVIVGVLVSGKQIISPVPEDDARTLLDHLRDFDPLLPAKLEMLRAEPTAWRNPYFWAPFVLVGAY